MRKVKRSFEIFKKPQFQGSVIGNTVEPIREPKNIFPVPVPRNKIRVDREIKNLTIEPQLSDVTKFKIDTENPVQDTEFMPEMLNSSSFKPTQDILSASMYKFNFSNLKPVVPEQNKSDLIQNNTTYNSNSASLQHI